MKKKRVLVISHNAFSSSNNMGKTLASLFYSFESDELAQLYFHSLNPDVNCTTTSYQITDFDILKSIINRQGSGRTTSFKERESVNRKTIKEKIYRFGRDHSPVKLMIRDLMWRLGNWKSKELFDWIEKFNPTAIFFAPGYSLFAYNITLFISKKYEIPIVTYFSDDYYNENVKTMSPIYWLRKPIFKKKVEKIVNESNKLVFISNSMEKEYAKTFEIVGQTIMTPYNQKYEKNITLDYKKTIRISYIGNVLLGRWKVLMQVAQAVTNINSNGKKIIFEIYSNNADDAIIKALNINDKSYYKGTLSPTAVKDKINKSDILLHVESFEHKNIEKTRHSISTKIADLLASNRTILAIGPEGIASIDYLKKNEAAYIIQREDLIQEKIIEYILKNEINKEIINNAYELALKNHDINVNSESLKNILLKSQKDK